MNSKRRGAVAVGRAISHFVDEGYSVFTPVSDVERFDFIAYRDGVMYRVEVKSTTQANGHVELRTKGGNLSGAGKITKISASDSEFVACVNLNTGFIKVFPSADLHGRTSIRVKGGA